MNQDRTLTITNSQLKDGYKQTEVGIIPEDWEVKKLNELFSLKNGFAFSSNYFSDRGSILLTPGNFKLDGGLYFNERNTKYFNGEYSASMQLKSEVLNVRSDFS